MQENWDKSVLFLGGARSGKSRLALEWVEESGLSPLYLATGVATDPEMEERILRHQRERSAMWKVEEVPFGLGEALEKTGGAGGGAGLRHLPGEQYFLERKGWRRNL